MSSSSPPNMLITSCITVALVGYSGYHAFKFDKGKCLIWQKGHMIRWAMVWAQLSTAFCYAIWAMGLTHLKWSVGYISLPVYGIVPVPYQLWSNNQHQQNNIYTAFLCTAFCLYDAVNLEEWLYWIYVVRAVRAKARQLSSSSLTRDPGTSFAPLPPTPRRFPFFLRRKSSVPPVMVSFTPGTDTKRPFASGPVVQRGGRRAAKKTAKWITSNVFLVWAVLSVAQTVVHFTTAFATHPNVDLQAIRLYMTEGIFNTITATLSIILAWQFPTFIRLVKDTGASSEVISKLQFYHELNKWRIFFRVLFAAGVIILGADGSTKAKTINLNSFAVDFLFQMVVLSFFFASICSWMLYLPVQWNKFTPTSGYLARHGQPMRRHQAQGRGLGARNTVGLTHQRGNPAPASGAAKALGSPAVASPYPFSDFTNADDAETSRQRMMMSKHSEQHRTLIDLLRERGTLGQDERVPEDDIFDDEAEAEARGFVQGYGGPGGKDEGTFATALAEPRVVYAPGSLGGFVPPISVPVHGARVGGERGTNNNVPHVLQNFESPAAGFSRMSVPPKNVVINVSRDVEIDRDEGESSAGRIV